MAIGDYSKINFVSGKTKGLANLFNKMDTKLKELDYALSQSSGGGNNTEHYHNTDRSRANHTGTQNASTIVDFVNTVRGTVLSGLSTSTNAIISTTDNILSAFGKLQSQITDLTSKISNKADTTALELKADLIALSLKSDASELATTNQSITILNTISTSAIPSPSTITSVTQNALLKNGHSVQLILRGTITTVVGTSYTLGTIPDGYRPSVAFYKNVQIRDTSAVLGDLTITTAGVVTLITRTAISAQLISINEFYITP